MLAPNAVRWRFSSLWRRPSRRQRWVWLLPLVMYKLVQREQLHLKTGIEALIGAGVVAVVARRPYRYLNVLLIVFPFGVLMLATLYRLHVPSQVVRGLDFWKEGILAGLAMAALLRIRAGRPTWDWADKLAIGYVALGTVYLLGQKLFVGNAVGANLSFYSRELGWRGDILYVGVFLIGRHLRLTKDQIEALFRRVLVVTIVVALIGVYEFFRPYSFNHFVTQVIRLGAYRANILHAPLGDPNNILAFGGGSHRVRIGSVFINNLEDGWYYVIGMALAAELIARGRARPWMYVGLAILGAADIFTQSRATILAGAVAVAIGLRRQIGRSVQHRVRLTLLAGLALIAALPLVVFSGLGHRFVGSSVSNQGHTNGVRRGISVMAANPFGRGLATGAGAGQTAVGKGLQSARSVFIPEDQWLQIGTQIGFLGLAIYVAFLVAIIRKMYPRGPNSDGSLSEAYSVGMRSALIGILVGGLFLQTFTEPVVSWTTFLLCGLAVSRIEDVANAENPYAVIGPGRRQGVTL